MEISVQYMEANYILVGLLILLFSMFLFKYLVSYNILEQIREGAAYGKGNKAVAWDFGGKLIAISKIVATSIAAGEGLFFVLGWSIVGIISLGCAFKLAGFILNDKKHKNLESGQETVGMFTCAISLSLAIVICSVIK